MSIWPYRSTQTLRAAPHYRPVNMKYASTHTASATMRRAIQGVTSHAPSTMATRPHRCGDWSAFFDP